MLSRLAVVDSSEALGLTDGPLGIDLVAIALGNELARPPTVDTPRWGVQPTVMIFIRIGALAGLLAVAFGAFGAHALRERLAPEMLSVYQTAVLYHLVHALAVLAVGILAERSPSTALTTSGWAFAAGLLLFSGSLYALAVSGVRVLGAVTPIGGVAFLVGWGALAWSTLR